MVKKLFFVLLMTAFASPSFADGNSYNCASDGNYFFVSLKTDTQGNWCEWRVRTGVTTPSGGYKPSVAVLHPIKFQLDKNEEFTIENCSPTSFSAKKMELYASTLQCSYIPNGAANRPQGLYFSPNVPYKLQEFKNSQWSDTEFCSQPDNCRIVPFG